MSFSVHLLLLVSRKGTMEGCHQRLHVQVGRHLLPEFEDIYWNQYWQK